MQQVVCVVLCLHILLFPFSLIAAAAHSFANCFTVQPKKVSGMRYYAPITQDIGSQKTPCMIIGFIEADNQDELRVKEDSVLEYMRTERKVMVDDHAVQHSTIVALQVYSSDESIEELRQLSLIMPPYIKNKIASDADLSTIDKQLHALKDAADSADITHEAPLLQLDVVRLNQYLQERYGITARHALCAQESNCIIN